MKNEFLTLLQQQSNLLEIIEDKRIAGFSFWDLQEPDRHWFSPGLYKALGFESEPGLGRSWKSWIVTDDHQRFEQFAWSKPVVDQEFVLGFYRQEGQPVWLPTRSIALQNQQGHRLLLVHGDPESENSLHLNHLKTLYSKPGETLVVLDPEWKIKLFHQDGSDPDQNPFAENWEGQSFHKLRQTEIAQPAIKQALVEILQQDAPIHLEYNLVQNGLEQVFSTSIHLLRDARRRPFELVISLRNISSEKKALHQLAQFQAVVSSLSDLTLVSDPKGLITWANPAFSQTTRLDPFAKGGLQIHELMGIETTRQDREKLDFALQHCLTTTLDFYRTTGPGPHYHLVMNMNPVFNEVGHCIHFVFTGREISEERIKEAQLENLHRFLKETNRNAQIGGWSFEMGSDKVYWSEEVFAIHETEADFVPTVESVLQFYAEGESRQKYFEAGMNAIQFGKSYDMELDIVTAKGNPIRVRVTGHAEMEDGQCLGLFGTFQKLGPKT